MIKNQVKLNAESYSEVLGIYSSKSDTPQFQQLKKLIELINTSPDEDIDDENMKALQLAYKAFIDSI